MLVNDQKMRRNSCPVQVANGIFQTVSWPCSVAIMAKWFGKGSRGSIMGLWCGVMNMGDILGMLSASMVVQLGWGWSFIIPGLFTVFMGGVLFLFLEESPPCAHMPLANKDGDEEAAKVQKKIQNQNGDRQVSLHSHMMLDKTFAALQSAI